MLLKALESQLVVVREHVSLLSFEYVDNST